MEEARRPLPKYYKNPQGALRHGALGSMRIHRRTQFDRLLLLLGRLLQHFPQLGRWQLHSLTAWVCREMASSCFSLAPPKVWPLPRGSAAFGETACPFHPFAQLDLSCPSGAAPCSRRGHSTWSQPAVPPAARPALRVSVLPGRVPCHRLALPSLQKNIPTAKALPARPCFSAAPFPGRHGIDREPEA